MLVLGLFVNKLRRIVLDIAKDEVATQIYDSKTTFNEHKTRETTATFTHSLSQKINLHTTPDRKAKLLLVMTRLTVLWYVFTILFILWNWFKFEPLCLFHESLNF